MGDIKAKLLGALDFAFEDISEERLIDILLDAYRGKVQKIEELKCANGAERQALRDVRDEMATQFHRMRMDPLYCLEGVYLFEGGPTGGRKFCVTVRGSHIDACERVSGIDYALQHVRDVQ